jgi:hypothetical protein
MAIKALRTSNPPITPIKEQEEPDAAEWAM